MFMAFLWTTYLGVNFISYLKGYEPTWFLVFFPTIELVFSYWISNIYEAITNKNDK